MSYKNKSWNHKTISRVKNLTYQLEPRAGQWLVYPEGEVWKGLYFEARYFPTARHAAEEYAAYNHRREIEARIRKGQQDALFGKGFVRGELTENRGEYQIIVAGKESKSYRVRVNLVALTEVLDVE